jgi:hypothetical protein
MSAHACFREAILELDLGKRWSVGRLSEESSRLEGRLTHGRGAIGHLLMGSVAERVVRTAPCPVLTVHQSEREFVLPDAKVALASATP